MVTPHRRLHPTQKDHSKLRHTFNVAVGRRADQLAKKRMALAECAVLAQRQRNTAQIIPSTKSAARRSHFTPRALLHSVLILRAGNLGERNVKATVSAVTTYSIRSAPGSTKKIIERVKGLGLICGHTLHFGALSF